MKKHQLFIALVMALCLSVAFVSVASAQDATLMGRTSLDDRGQSLDENLDEEADKEEKSWGVAADLTFDLGVGAFVKNKYARRVRSKFGFEASGYYKIPVIDTNIELATGFTAWMSKAGGSNGVHEFRWTDSYIGFSRELYSYKGELLRFMLNAGLGFAIPTSKASWTTNLYTSIMPQLGMGLKIARFGVFYAVRYSHNFNKYTSASVDPNEVDALSRSAGNELLSRTDIAIAGVLTEIELVNAFSLSYDILDELVLSVGFAFADFWTYDSESLNDDDYTNPNAKPGRGHGQMSAGSVALAYTPWRYTTITFFLKSEQPWKQKDNKELRFPWFDTISYSKNYTKFGVTATFRY
ncbi:MAG: hypothetical protein WC966_04655 [Bradymonadales bacterium]